MKKLVDFICSKLNISTENRQHVGVMVRSAFSIVGIGALCIIAVIAFSMKTFTWFSSNNQVSATGTSVITKLDDTTVSYTFYKYDINEEIVKENDNLEEIDFNQYDLIFLSHNRYSATYVKISLYRGEFMPEEGTLKIDLTRDESKVDSSDKSYSSRLLRFTLENEDKGIYNNHDYYNELMSKEIGNTDKSKTFATVDSDDITLYEKTDKISLELNYDSSSWNDNQMDVYLYITYDELLIDNFRESEHNLSSMAIGRNIIDLDNDLKEIVITYTQGA